MPATPSPRHQADSSVELAFLKTDRNQPDPVVERGLINELSIYRQLLDTGFWQVHETEATYDLVPRLVARARADGLEVSSDIVAYDDTVWDEYMLVEVTDSQGVRYELPKFGDRKFLRERRERIASDWGETIVRARRRAESERQAAIAKAHEESSPAERCAQLERISSRLDQLESITGRLRTSPVGRGLPGETFLVWQRYLRMTLNRWASLGGCALPNCEAAGTRDTYSSTREAKFAALANAKREVRQEIAGQSTARGAT